MADTQEVPTTSPQADHEADTPQPAGDPSQGQFVADTKAEAEPKTSRHFQDRPGVRTPAAVAEDNEKAAQQAKAKDLAPVIDEVSAANVKHESRLAAIEASLASLHAKFDALKIEPAQKSASTSS